MIANQPTRLTVEAVVIRVDGSREDLGVVASNDPTGPGDVRVQQVAEQVMTAPGMPIITLAKYPPVKDKETSDG